jgi:hypothetical protein
MVLVGEWAVTESKDVDFVLRGDVFCTGRLFCSLAAGGLLSPLEALMGDFWDAMPRVGRARFVATVRAGRVSLLAAPRSNLLAMSFTRPGREGSCAGLKGAGLERTLVEKLWPSFGPDMERGLRLAEDRVY